VRDVAGHLNFPRSGRVRIQARREFSSCLRTAITTRMTKAFGLAIRSDACKTRMCSIMSRIKPNDSSSILATRQFDIRKTATWTFATNSISDAIDVCI